MPKTTSRKPLRKKIKTRRTKPLAVPMRPLVFWLPDVNSPEFIREARRQSRLIARSPHTYDDQAFVDAISELKF